MADKKNSLWIAVGVLIVLFLLVTTPGWKEVLGISGSLSLGGYLPAILILVVMGGMMAFMLMGGEKKDDEE